jgi:Transposase DDE domain
MRSCSQVAPCVRSTKRDPRRTLTIQPQQPHQTRQAARQCDATQAFRVEDTHRAGIEGTIARGTRAVCLRRPRDIDPMRVHLGDLLTAVEVNALRLGEWMVQMTHNVTMERGDSCHLDSIGSMTGTGNVFPSFSRSSDAAGVTRVPLPARSLNLNGLRGAMGAISQGRVFLAADCVR